MKARLLTIIAATSLVTAPTMAAAAAIPGASLSIAKSVRAGSRAGQDKLSGGTGFIAVAIGIALVALVTVAIVDDDDNSDSN